MEGINFVGKNLVHHVLRLLRYGVAFKTIALNIGIEDPHRLKNILTRELGYNFCTFTPLTMEEVHEAIITNLSIFEHGRNWDICHMKVALARLDIKVPRPKVVEALRLISSMSFSFLCHFYIFFSLSSFYPKK